MRSAVLVLLICALFAQKASAVACTKSLTANANSGGGCSDQAGTLNCVGSATGSAGTCAASCSNTASATQCVGTDALFCNANNACVASPACTASNAATTCTDSNNNYCVGASTTTATCGPTCSNTASTTQCVDNTRPYCGAKSSTVATLVCQAAPACTISSTCSDTNNAQCVNSKCAATCNHATGAYCTDSATTSPKIYCSTTTSTGNTGAGTCSATPASSLLTAAASIPANCAIGASTTSCTQCKPGYGLTGSSGSYTCVACYSGCLDCIMGNSNSSCIAYKYSVDGTPLIATQAQANCSANFTPGAVSSTTGAYTCYACSTNCTACTSPNTASPASANNSAYCQTCAAYSYGNGSVTLVNTSATSTPVIWYYNCVGCPANCSSCTNSTYCLKCNGTLTWNNSTKKCFATKISSGLFVVGAVIFAAFSL